MNTKSVGNIGEQIAAEYLEEKGYTILERNVTYAGTEVDIIAECNASNKKRLFKKPEPDTLVFCEVKTRTNDSFGSGVEAVTAYKAGRYIRAAEEYIVRKSVKNRIIRFDIIEISNDQINHIISAFDQNDAKYPGKF